MLNQTDHADINWGTYAIENNWPTTTDKARAKWVLAGRGIIPYGTYVIMDDTLYVSTQELLDKLDAEYFVVECAVLEANDHI